MNRKANPETVKTIIASVRFTEKEYINIQKKAKALGVSLSKYCHEMSMEGHIVEKPNTHDWNEVRLLRQVLIEYRRNFSRISNLISISSPLLNDEVREVKNKIEKAIEKF